MTNDDLIKLLIEDGCLKSPRIIEAFRAVDRKDFVLDDYKDEAYENHPLPIGFGQTISQPLTVAFMLELLDLQPGDRVLEIGTGSGWAASLMAHIVRQKPDERTSGRAGAKQLLKRPLRKGEVFAIERLGVLKEMAERNIKKYGFVEEGVMKIFVGDGSKGYAPGAPFDKIVSAATAEAIPVAWKEQLHIHGRIVAPVHHKITVLERTSQHEFDLEEYGGFRFVPLLSGTDSGGGA